MSALLAKCGNRCDVCPLYRDNFEKLGPETVNAGIYKYHQRRIGVPPHFDRACEGCPDDGYVARCDCPIRACATRRKLPSCAACPDLFCDLLEADMKVIEGAVRDFEGVIPAEDFEIFLKPFLIRARLRQMRTAQ